MPCKAIVKFGKRKGQACGKNIKPGTSYCGNRVHARLPTTIAPPQFLTIPRETRDEIYRYLFPEKIALPLGRPQVKENRRRKKPFPLGLLLVNDQIRAEFQETMFREKTFRMRWACCSSTCQKCQGTPHLVDYGIDQDPGCVYIHRVENMVSLTPTQEHMLKNFRKLELEWHGSREFGYFFGFKAHNDVLKTISQVLYKYIGVTNTSKCARNRQLDLCLKVERPMFFFARLLGLGTSARDSDYEYLRQWAEHLKGGELKFKTLTEELTYTEEESLKLVATVELIIGDE